LHNEPIILGYIDVRLLNSSRKQIITAYKQKYANKPFKEELIINFPLDLDDFESIFWFVHKISSENFKIASVFHNASQRLANNIGCSHITSFFLEKTMSTNYFGPFFLTELLAEYLKRQYHQDGYRVNMLTLGTDSIVKTHKSKCHFLTFNLNFQDRDQVYSGKTAFIHSKIALTLWQQYLAKIYENIGLDTVIYCPVARKKKFLQNLQHGKRNSVVKGTDEFTEFGKHAPEDFVSNIFQFLTTNNHSQSGKIFKDADVEIKLEIENNSFLHQMVLYEDTRYEIVKILERDGFASLLKS